MAESTRTTAQLAGDAGPVPDWREQTDTSFALLVKLANNAVANYAANARQGNPMSDDVIFVRPMPGCVVRDPDSMELLPEDGAWVPRNVFWIRRLYFGDVTDLAAHAGEQAAGSSVDHETPPALVDSDAESTNAQAKPASDDAREE